MTAARRSSSRALVRALLTLVGELIAAWSLGSLLVALIGKDSWGALAGFLLGGVLGAGAALAVGLVVAARSVGASKRIRVGLALGAVPLVWVAAVVAVRFELSWWGPLLFVFLPGPLLVWWVGRPR